MTSNGAGVLAWSYPADYASSVFCERRLIGFALFALLGFGSPAEQLADKVVVQKKQRRMMLMQGDKILREYRVALGSEPEGPKQQQGDHRTPEGLYRIDSRNARSRFHLALHISYPNDFDVRRARKLGVNPGGAIMIHGLPKGFDWMGAGHRLHDWTDGCIAVTNAEIEEIWRLVPNGTAVEIRP